jgi:hypothetical protein
MGLQLAAATNVPQNHGESIENSASAMPGLSQPAKSPHVCIKYVKWNFQR